MERWSGHQEGQGDAENVYAAVLTGAAGTAALRGTLDGQYRNARSRAEEVEEAVAVEFPGWSGGPIAKVCGFSARR